MIVVQKPGGDTKIGVDFSKLSKFVRETTHSETSPKVASDIPLYQKYFLTLNSIKYIDKYLWQKNVKNQQHLSHYGGDTNIFDHVLDFAER